MGTENGRRKCGRKKTKSSEGKIPQRGMGVAQLEWHMKHQGSEGGSSKKDINPNPNQNFHSYDPQTAVHPYYPSYFTDQAAASRSFGSGTLNQQQGLVVQRVGPNGFIVGPGQSSSGFGYVYPDQFPVLDQYGVGPPNSYYQPSSTAGNVNVSCDMSKDIISYVPNIQHCPAARVCPKKKRYNGEISGSVGGSGEITGKDSYGSFNGSSIISAGNYKQNYLGQSQDFGTKLSMHHPFPGPKIELQDGGAVHECKAKGSSMRGSRNMVMEYEFFPEKEKGEKSSIFKDWIRLGSESSSVAAGGYGETNSCLSTTNTSAGFGGASSSSIDLSLKLSY